MGYLDCNVMLLYEGIGRIKSVLDRREKWWFLIDSQLISIVHL